MTAPPAQTGWSRPCPPRPPPNGVAWRFPNWTAVGFRSRGAAGGEPAGPPPGRRRTLYKVTAADPSRTLCLGSGALRRGRCGHAGRGTVRPFGAFAPAERCAPRDPCVAHGLPAGPRRQAPVGVAASAPAVAGRLWRPGPGASPCRGTLSPRCDAPRAATLTRIVRRAFFSPPFSGGLAGVVRPGESVSRRPAGPVFPRGAVIRPPHVAGRRLPPCPHLVASHGRVPVPGHVGGVGLRVRSLLRFRRSLSCPATRGNVRNNPGSAKDFAARPIDLSTAGCKTVAPQDLTGA